MRGICLTNKILNHGKITTKIIFSQEKREKSARPTICAIKTNAIAS